MPQPLARVVESGASVVGKVPESQVPRLIEAAIRAGTGSALSSKNPLVEQFSLTVDEANSVASSITVLMTLLTEEKTTNAAEFVDAMSDAGIVASESIDAVRRIVEHIVSAQSQINQAIRRRKAEVSVLPSITAFSTTIDVRLGFKEDEIDVAIPMVVAHVDTDGPGQELWMQLTKADIEQMMTTLTDAMGRLETVEKWLQRHK
jgi:hypothetical protein